MHKSDCTQNLDEFNVGFAPQVNIVACKVLCTQNLNVIESLQQYS